MHFFKQYLATPYITYIENMFVYTFTIYLTTGMARCCLKYLAPCKQNKTDALLGWFHTIGEQCTTYLLFLLFLVLLSFLLSFLLTFRFRWRFLKNANKQLEMFASKSNTSLLVRFLKHRGGANGQKIADSTSITHLSWEENFVSCKKVIYICSLGSNVILPGFFLKSMCPIQK